jgi:hypothetical protein
MQGRSFVRLRDSECSCNQGFRSTQPGSAPNSSVCEVTCAVDAACHFFGHSLRRQACELCSTCNAVLSEEGHSVWERCCNSSELSQRRCSSICTPTSVESNVPPRCPCTENASQCSVTGFHTGLDYRISIERGDDGSAYLLGRNGVRCVGIRGFPKSSTTFTAGLSAAVMARQQHCTGRRSFADPRYNGSLRVRHCGVYGSIQGVKGREYWRVRAWQLWWWSVYNGQPSFESGLQGAWQGAPLLYEKLAKYEESKIWAWAAGRPVVLWPTFNKHLIGWPIGMAVIAVLRDPRAVARSIFCWPESKFANKCRRGEQAPKEYVLTKTSGAVSAETSYSQDLDAP